MDDALRRQRKARFPRAVHRPLQDALAQRRQRRCVRKLALNVIGKSRETQAKITYHFRMGEEHLFDVGRRVAHMNDLGSVRAHDERRLFDRVMADRQDQVSTVYCLVKIVAFAERRGSHPEFAGFVMANCGHGTLAHLGVEKRDAGTSNEFGQLAREPGTVARGAEHDKRTLGLHQHGRGPFDGSLLRDRKLDRMRRNKRHVVAYFLGGHVFGQLEVDRTGPLFRGEAERFAHHARDAAPADYLPRRLRQRLHGCDYVDYLKARLVRCHDGLLPGDKHHRHGAEMGVGCTCDQIQRAGTEGCHADTRPSRQAAVGGRHECRRLLMAGDDQLDVRASQRLDDVEIFFARHRENAIDALVLQRLDEQI
ncbi:hypothetical protein PAMC26577_01995 [Caballeronia sordidicola]|uniref:Uncharacterized protein n=1 Tax=Caballeronia sordidicola TaxID=196367 RepID=A0A242N833_CABSO|nr:hypothetical protein PAMC26577_01995 [Caballeronia sordidicola]